MTEFDASLKAVLAELDKLPVRVEANLSRGALRAAAKPMFETARERVPVKSGALKDTIRLSSAIKKKTGEIVVRIVAGSRVSGGSAKGKTGADRGAFYAHIVEFGAAAHTIKGPVVIGGKTYRNIKHPGARASPFMRPAFDTSDQRSVDAFAEYMKKNIEKALAKNGGN